MNSLTHATKVRVGLRIKQARKQSGLSHDKIAAQVGTSRQHLIKLEKGLHLPGVELLDRIAEATGKTPAFFTADDTDDEESALTAHDIAEVLLDLVRARKVAV